jgi:mycobactin peptide synthetase MbtE
VLYGPPARYRRGRRVHDVFLQVAADQPHRPAIDAPDGITTYAQLEAASRRVAFGLAEAGIGPGDIVPVLLPRSPDMIAVLLGVLMRGAAYAALDTAWSPARVSSVLDVVDAQLLVTDRPVAGRRAWTPPDHLFIRPDPPTVPIPAGDGDAACSVFLTSGSTGAPKPVLSPHRATTRLVEAGAMAGEFGPDRRMPQWAAVSWDAYSLELWSMLLTGGTCVLDGHQLPTPGALRRLVTRGVNALWLTTSLFNLFVDEDLDSFGGLTQVWTGGERLSAAHVRRFLTRHPAIRLVNGYGPVESCVFATTHEIRPADCDDPHGIPVGSPVAGTSVVILDGDRPCRPGEPGEVCILGDGLAAGYLGDELLTAERFVQVDLDSVRTRLYRTGDRGAIGSDGLLRFLGRLDRQVKLRGFRIELGEVEGHLRGVDGVAEAVVLADHDPSGTCTGLTGFYVPRPDTTTGWADAVRDSMRRSLPPHLVPARLFRVSTIPVTANGKADHSALRRSIDAADVIPPPVPTSVGDPVLVETLDVVAAVLGTAGTVDTRLDRGTMTSLTAVRLCIRLNERFTISLTPEDLMDAPTVADVAQLVRQARPRSAPHPTSDPAVRVPLADTQLGFILDHALFPRGTAGQYVLSWLVRGQFDQPAFARALADVEHRHPGLRAAYHGAAEPYLMPAAQDGPGLADLGEFPDARSAWDGAAADLRRPLDIGAGRVWRANCARMGPELRLISLVVHHIAFDGWSESVLIRDLSTAYAARRAGRAPVFSPATVELAGALAARRADVAADSSTAARKYWGDLLAGLPEHDALRPATRSEPAVVAVCSRDVPPAALELTRLKARSLGTTVFPHLVGAYAQTLIRVLGQAEFGIGVPVSVRRHPNQADVVTCLVDTVCLRVGPVPDRESDELPRRIHEQMRAARGPYALPFPEVVRAVNPPRRPGRNPLFRTMFAYQDLDVRSLAIDGAHTELYRRGSVAPMCELVVEVWLVGNGARVDATFFPEAVSERSVAELLAAYVDSVSTRG